MSPAPDINDIKPSRHRIPPANLNSRSIMPKAYDAGGLESTLPQLNPIMNWPQQQRRFKERLFIELLKIDFSLLLWIPFSFLFLIK